MRRGRGSPGIGGKGQARSFPPPGSPSLLQEPAGWWPNLSGVQGMPARKGCALDGCISQIPPVPPQLAAQCPFPSNFSLPGPSAPEDKQESVGLGRKDGKSRCTSVGVELVLAFTSPLFRTCALSRDHIRGSHKALHSHVPFLNPFSCRQKRPELPPPDARPCSSRLCKDDTLLP